MNTLEETNKTPEPKTEEQNKRDVKREETNKTDPQLTELRGYVDPKEPLEEKGTPNPLLGTVE